MKSLAYGQLEVEGNLPYQSSKVLTPEAIRFLADLEMEFRPRRKLLLHNRTQRQAMLNKGEKPDFLPSTKNIREDPSWKVAAIPADLQNRRIEITGPTDRKMMINAMNSGANIFMADFEDANSPTWNNMIEGQANLREVIDRTITFTSPEGKNYRLNDDVATLMIRPRGWHLTEKHLRINGESVSASLFDAALYFFHNARTLLEKAAGPYFYLPKLESHLEARLWNDAFCKMQDALEIPRGSVKVTVLIETILGAFEMEEILYELRDHIAGLNAGRWDYIFSIIKKFNSHPDVLFPDRAQVTMAVPFMRAYTNLLVKTCHSRGAHAIGGMAAFIPSRKDAKVNEIALAKVREDKERECEDGFDGTWVAHPDLVRVAREPFDRVLKDKPHQKEQLREDVNVSAADILNFQVPNGQITENGLRNNISVALQYLESWLNGTGAVGIYNLMEDAATAEISRSQVWQWLHHHPTALLADGRAITTELYRSLLQDEIDKISATIGEDHFRKSKYKLATELFDRLVLTAEYPEFLTLAAYDYL